MLLLTRAYFRNVIMLTQISQILIEFLNPIAVRFSSNLGKPLVLNPLCLLEVPPLRRCQMTISRSSSLRRANAAFVLSIICHCFSTYHPPNTQKINSPLAEPESQPLKP